MVVLKKWLTIIVLLMAGSALVLWLLTYEQAAQPRPLSSGHRSLQDCSFCHQPWKGVTIEKCKQCHFFSDSSQLRKEIRFHEAGEKCLLCHKEHGLMGESITCMQHGILNEELMCTKCHFDQHSGLFGRDCRECHGIRSWDIESYEHPPAKNRKCHLCHKAPVYHYDQRYWQMMLKDMRKKSVKPDQCWECHTISHWDHLKMEHTLSPKLPVYVPDNYRFPRP